MKNLFLVLSRGGLLRKFAESRVIHKLSDKGFRVVICTPPSPEQGQCAPLLGGLDIAFEPLRVARPTIVRRILQEFERAVIFNDTVKARFRYTIASKTDPSRLLVFPRLYLLPLTRFIPGMKRFLRFLGLVLDPQEGHEALFEKYRPAAVFSTTPHDESEAALLKSALRNKVPIVSMPKSWDNIPKILFPVKGKKLLVWGSYMKDEAVAFQDYAPAEIVETGAPEFDRYAHPERLWSREAFARRHGLDPDKKIILYGSGGADMTDEPRFIDVLDEYVRAHPNTQVLIRPHAGYKDDTARYARFAGRAGIRIDKTIVQYHSPQSAWDASPERADNLYNSLHHADVCVNISSTLTIDATLCGAPVVNVDFDVDSGLDPKRRSVKRLFETSYTRAIMRTGATWRARSRTELFAALDETLAHRGARTKARETLIRQFAYKNDGGAADRIADAVAAAV